MDSTLTCELTLSTMMILCLSVSQWKEGYDKSLFVIKPSFIVTFFLDFFIPHVRCKMSSSSEMYKLLNE